MWSVRSAKLRDLQFVSSSGGIFLVFAGVVFCKGKVESGWMRYRLDGKPVRRNEQSFPAKRELHVAFTMKQI